MSDLSYLDPPIEIAATGARLKIVAARLRTGGMRPYGAAETIDFDSADPLLVDLASVHVETLKLCRDACLATLRRPLIILDIANAGLTLSDTITIRRDRDLSLVKGRLSAMARRSARVSEVEIRAQTARLFGARTAARRPPEPALIYLGQSSPLFLSLQSALATHGVSLTSALTRTSTRAYLTRRRFTAALMDMTSSGHSVQNLDRFAPDEWLNGLPVLALIDGDSRLPEDVRSILLQCDEIIECQDGEPDVAVRILELIEGYLTESPLQPTASVPAAATDRVTGLFSRRFLEAHLERQMAIADNRCDALSIMTLKLTGNPRTVPSALASLAQCVQNLMRETDCAAVVEPGTIAVSLPLTPYRGGVHLANRIALAVSEQDLLIELILNWRVVEKRACHTAQSFLEAGLTGPFMRLDAA
jgi:GGDEF domain-containing protein